MEQSSVRGGNIVQNTVHKKNDELMLWEVDSPVRKKKQKSGVKRQETLSVIPIDEQGRTAGRKRKPDGIRADGNNRVSGSSRERNRVRQTGNARPSERAGQAGRVRPSERVGQTGNARAAGRAGNAGAADRVRQSGYVRASGSAGVVQTGRARQQISPQAIKRRQARRRRAYFYRALAFCMIGVCVVLLGAAAGLLYRTIHREEKRETWRPVEKETPLFGKKEDTGVTAPEISTDYLDINDYSRPGTPLTKVNSIFVHYTANPGTSAVQNRSYFANLAETHERSASAHFIIGYEGEIVQCIPLEEQAYAVMTRNEDSISIECCYVDEDGKFTQETYDSLIHLLAWLTEEYHLESGDILRHYDCGGKRCPLYYVEHEDLWGQLLADVNAYKENAHLAADSASQ